MKRLGGTFIFCGIILIIGPFFGVTIRNQETLDYGSSFLLGIISLLTGFFFSYLGKEKNKM